MDPWPHKPILDISWNRFYRFQNFKSYQFVLCRVILSHYSVLQAVKLNFDQECNMYYCVRDF